MTSTLKLVIYYLSVHCIDINIEIGHLQLKCALHWHGGGVNQHMENFMFSCFDFLKLPLITHQVQEMLSHLINFETSTWHFKVMKQKCINIITIQNGLTDRQENKAKPDLLCNCEIIYLYFNYPLHLWFVCMAWVIKNFYQASKFYVFYTANPRGKGRLFNHQKILLFVIHQ